MNFLIISTIIFTIILLTETTADNVTESMRCCHDDEGENIIFNNTCKDGTKLRLDCEKYVLDPSSEEDEDKVLDIRGDRLFYDGYYYANGSFCVVDYEHEELLYEIAFVCFPNDPNTNPVFFYIKGALLLISCIFTSLTLYIYYICPEFRDTQDKATIFSLICITVFYFYLSMIQLIRDIAEVPFLCESFAFIILFSVLGHLAWLNAVICNMWKSFVLRIWNIAESKWYILLHCYGWGVPIILTTFCLIGHHTELYDGPKFGEGSCWFGGRHLAWKYLYTPICIMLAINFIFEIWVAFVLYKMGTDVSEADHTKHFRYKFKIYTSLFVLAGLTWTFEILSNQFQTTTYFQVYWFMTDIFSAVYGVILFIILIVWRKRVRRTLGGRKICCFTVPMKFKQISNDEDSTLEGNVINSGSSAVPLTNNVEPQQIKNEI